MWEYNKTNFDRNLAVVIGIDRYQSDSIHDLSTPVSDARAIADLLETEYEYQPDNVVRLFDAAATLTGLQTLLTDTLPKLNPGKYDRLIFYFAGHGIPCNSKEGPKGYLVPQDADWQKQNSFLSMSEMYEALSKLECHHLLVILDCCFAGTFRWASSRKMIPILETVRREHYDRFIRYPAWQVITSAAHDQEALDVAKLAEDKRGAVAGEQQELHSPFALALLEGLRDKKADMILDGVITAHELYLYLEERVSELSGDRQKPGIYPLKLDYDRGEFVFTKPGFDPVTNLKAAPPLNEENNPYRGLKPFEERHSRFFFGRKLLVEELSHHLCQSDRSLTVVLGASGCGKSSLVKAGLIPELRERSNPEVFALNLIKAGILTAAILAAFPQFPLKFLPIYRVHQWYLLAPMRPERFPFRYLARAILPIEQPELIDRLSQVSFLDEVFKPKDESGEDDRDGAIDAAFIKLANLWNSATPEDKILLVEDYFKQLKGLCRNPQEQKQLSQLALAIFKQLKSLSVQLQNEPQYLTNAIVKWSESHPNTKLLLTIDQFEELITMSQESQTETQDGNKQKGNYPNKTVGDRAAESPPWLLFLQVLKRAIVECPQQVHILLTLRSDFEPRFLSSPLAADWKDARFPVRAMNLEELRQAIEAPALKQALYFEPPELTSKLIDEVGQMPGSLSLLSFVLSELYIKLAQRWKEDPNSSDRALRIKEELGGVAGALTRRATEEYDNLVRDFGEVSGKAYQATMRRVMLRMVTIEGGGAARRRVPESELVYPDAAENQRVAQVSERLVKARLLVTGQETGEPHIEPAHDFLVRGWDKLQGWIGQEQTNLILQQRLTPAALDWESKHKQNRLLWNAEPNLDLFEQVLHSPTNCWFNEVESNFIKSSVSRKRKNITLRWVGVGCLLFATTTAAFFFNNLRQLADRRELIARQNLYASNMNLANQEWGKSQITQFTRLLDNSYPQADRNDLRGFEWYYFWKLAHSDRVTLKHGQSVTSVAVSPDGKTLATVNSDMRRMNSQNSIKLWQLATGEELPVAIPGHSDGTVSVAFSPDGKVLATGGLNDASVMLWDVSTGKELKNYRAGTGYEGIGRHGTVHTVKFSPDGKLVALFIRPLNCATEATICTAIGFSSIVKVLDVATGQENGNFPVANFGRDVAFSPDSKTLAISSSNFFSSKAGVVLWDLKTKKEQSKLELSDGSWARSLAFSPDGKTLILGGDEVRAWNIVNRGTPQRIGQHRQNVVAVAFSPNGRIVASASSDRTIKLWDTNTYLELATIQGHAQAISSIAFSPDSKTLVTGSADRTAKVWDIEQVTRQSDASGDSFTFSPDGRTLVAWDAGATFGRVVVGSESEVKLLDGTTLQEFAAFGNSGGDSHVVVSPDSQFLLTWDVSNIKLWDINTGQEIVNRLQWMGRSDAEQIHIVAVSPNSQIVAAGSHKVIVLWQKDAERWQQLPALNFGNTYIESIVFSPDSKTLVAVNADGVATVWNVATRKQQTTFKLSKDSAYISEVSLEFSPDGKTLVTGVSGNAGFIKFWDTKTWKERANLTSNFPVWEFSPDRKTIAIAGNGESAQLVDIMTAKTIQTFEGHTETVRSLTFSPDGRRLVSGSKDGSVKIWNPVTGTELLTLGANLGDVRAVDFAPDGKNLVVSYWQDDKRRLRFWRAARDEEIWIDNLRTSNPAVFAEGEKLALKNNLDGAILQFQTILRADPKLNIDPAKVARYLAVQKTLLDIQKLAQTWNFEGVVAQLRHVLELNPALTLNPKMDAQRSILLAHRPVVVEAQEHIRQGFNYKQQGEVDKIVPEFTIGIDLLVPLVQNGYPAPPSLLEAYIERGVQYFVKQQYDRAIVNWQAAAQIVPSDARAWGNMGFAYYELGQLDSAIAMWKKTAELDAKYDEAWAGLGIALYEQGKVKEGILMYQKALELEPNFKSVNWLRASRNWSEKSLRTVAKLLQSASKNSTNN